MAAPLSTFARRRCLSRSERLSRRPRARQKAGAMAILAAVIVALAAVLHVYIFLMESVWWTRPATWKRFGVASQAFVLFTTAAMVLAATGSRQRVAAIFGQHSTNTRPTHGQHTFRVRCRSWDSCCSCSPELNSSGPRVAPSTLAAHFCVRGVCSGARREHKGAPQATGYRTVEITA